jgi:hypothetical protein
MILPLSTLDFSMLACQNQPKTTRQGVHLKAVCCPLFFLSFALNHYNIIMVKYTIPFLTKLEDMIAESDYTLRYEKGNFKSGYCVLKDQKIIIVNKFYTTEGKINALMEILKGITLDGSRFTEKSQKLYEELMQQFEAA